jgi:CheY-like chemotaxis protein
LPRCSSEHDRCRVIERAKTAVPKVFLLDIGLPEMNGYELATHLRAQPETLMRCCDRSDRIRQERATGYEHGGFNIITWSSQSILINQ